MRCRLKCHNERNPCRQLPSSSVGDSGGTATARCEEGGDDVKSASMWQELWYIGLDIYLVTALTELTVHQGKCMYQTYDLDEHEIWNLNKFTMTEGRA